MASLVQRTQTAVEYIVKYYRDKIPSGVFCQELYDSIKVVDVKTDEDKLRTVVYKVHTSQYLRNAMGMVHGGASSTMIVLFSALSIASDDKYWKSSEPTAEELKAFALDIPSTRSADIQILQAVPLDADVFVKCHVVSNTKSNAYVDAKITNSNGKTLVVGVHDMMRNPPTGEEQHALSAHYPYAKL